MSYSLSIAVYGLGTDPRHRSHWAFFLHLPEGSRGNMVHVLLIDGERLWYQLDQRFNVPILSPGSEGYFFVAAIPADRYQRVYELIAREDPPRNGRDRCQDWIVNCIAALEVEELVPAGTTSRVESLSGLSSAEVARRVGDSWRGA